MPAFRLRTRGIVMALVAAAGLVVACDDVAGTQDPPVAASSPTAAPSPTTAPTPAPTAAPTPSPRPSHAPRPVAAAASTPPPVVVANVGPVYAVGDSVTIDIAGPLRRDVPGVVVNGQVGRQFSVGISIISGLHASGTLPPMVVVALGTNGTVTSAQIDQMMRAAAGAKRVVFVTVHVPRVWQDPDNAVIRAATRYPNVAIADWNALSAGHTSWFAPDGYHLTAPGASALAALIASVL